MIESWEQVSGSDYPNETITLMIRTDNTRGYVSPSQWKDIWNWN